VNAALAPAYSYRPARYPRAACWRRAPWSPAACRRPTWPCPRARRSPAACRYWPARQSRAACWPRSGWPFPQLRRLRTRRPPPASLARPLPRAPLAARLPGGRRLRPGRR
jgi:hypothetical protein